MKIETVARAIEIPVSQWPGACHGISIAVLRAGLVQGKPRYGHWHGPISRDCLVKSFIGRPFTHHGWIELRDQRVCDPTRWVFEARVPYIYQGPPDFYDAGGNALREATEGECPALDSGERMIALSLPVEVADHVYAVSDTLLTVDQPASISQIFWLSNLSLGTLGDCAAAIYGAIIDVNLAAFIPLDNRTLVLGD